MRTTKLEIGADGLVVLLQGVGCRGKRGFRDQCFAFAAGEKEDPVPRHASSRRCAFELYAP